MIDPLALPLHDIHLPPPISWWPLATGWWLLLAGILATATIASTTRYWWQRGKLRRAAQRRLREIAVAFKEHQDSHRLARELSVLCRQLVSQVSTDSAVMSEVGAAWLFRLNHNFGTEFFTVGLGRTIFLAAYDRKTLLEPKPLLTGIADLLVRLPPATRTTQQHV
ncbi:MAG: DUF4381 domain-containing protein [Gammaproteobacteria bacterium]|nr:DUF4381 domain-containing protein [Gammaproteobacteria bacterium]